MMKLLNLFLGISPPKSRVSPFAGFRFCSNFANKI